MRADNFPRPTGEQLERKGIKKKGVGRKGGEMGSIWRAGGGRASSPIDSISPPLLQHLGLMRRVDLHPNYILPFFLAAYSSPSSSLFNVNDPHFLYIHYI